MAKKDLHTLIRLRKWDVDEKQRALAVLLRQEEVTLRQAGLEAEVENEIAFTATLPADQRSTLAAYLKRCDEFRQKLAAVLEEVRRQIVGAENQLAEAYRRLKTFEITQEARDAAAAAEERRLEEIELNELGLELYRRKVQPV